MERKTFKVGDVVYLASWSGITAYRIGSIKTNEYIGGVSTEIRADSKGNSTYLNLTDTFADAESARQHMIRLINENHDEELARFEEGNVEEKYI